MTTATVPVKVSRRIVRANKTLKHYRNNILTIAGVPTETTLVELLTDLRHMAAKQDMSFEDCVKQSLTTFNEESD